MAVDFSRILEHIQQVRDEFGYLPPLLIANGQAADPGTLESAVRSALGCSGWRAEEMLIVDLASSDAATPQSIMGWQGPVILDRIDEADPDTLRACLKGEVLGPLCRPVIALSSNPSRSLSANLPFAIIDLA